VGCILTEGQVEAQGSALRLDGICKSFGPTRALADVSLTVARGEVHGLVGGNGSGKSTLIKILSGVVKPDSGTIRIGEATLTGVLGSRPEEAREAGLRVVHQKSSVFPDLSVAENLALGAEFPRRRIGAINWRAQRRRASEVLERFGIDADPADPVQRLRPATRAMVAIARALQDLNDDRPGTLVLDEPTASLPPSEVHVVLEAMRRYAAAGHAVIFVSHRLDEVLSATDRLTVLKDGVEVAELSTADTDHDQLAELIAGRSLAGTRGSSHVRRASDGGPGLSVQGLSGGGLKHASFTVDRGEIVGVAGLLGSGRSSLLRLLFGVTQRTGGTVTLSGRPLSPRKPIEAMRAGVAYVPEDRTSESVFSELSLVENLSIAGQERYWRRGLLRKRREMRDSLTLIDAFGIKCESPSASIAQLSGGNQQKAILARWMRREPSLLLLDEPTHGVDVGAREDIYSLVRQAAGQGTCVLVVSSDAEELELLCDRLLVLRDGVTVDSIGAEDLPDSHLEKIV
jgi:ribose transport system ATP-binding protein